MGAAAYRSDVSAIKAITGRATTQAVTENQTLFGFALVGGFYLYATVPYVFVAPIIGLGSCTASLNTLISYGGPSECTYDDPPPPEGRTCTSNMTLLDTMGDQGWPSMYSTPSFLPSTQPGLPRGCQPRVALVSHCTSTCTCGLGRGGSVALWVPRWAPQEVSF